MGHTMSEKDDIRKALLDERLLLSEERVHTCSRATQERLLKSPYWPKSGRVGLYAAVKNEILTHDLFQRALEQGLHVYFPRVEQGIRFYEVNGPEELRRGSWSIPEPIPDCPILSEEDNHRLDLLVVPGIGFTRDGFRVGYGKGFYDQYLGKYAARCVGLAYDFQIVDGFSKDSWDKPLSAVVTEKAIYKAKEAH
jgi:5-formyltetrahydrofolate cyclo-ligase